MEIVNITYLGSGEVYQDYNARDTNLITTNFITPNFGNTTDYVEFFVYDELKNLISSNYNLTSYKPYQNNASTNLFTGVILDPKYDLSQLGINRGRVQTQYNFFRNIFNSNIGARYWIKEISPSRTELKIASQDISNIAIQEGLSRYQTTVTTNNYYNDFYLNFAANQLILAVNVAYDEDDVDSYLLIKLYEPLPFDFNIKDTLWIVEKAAESISYEVDIQIPAIEEETSVRLRGPNFNIKANTSVGQTTPYYNYNSLFSSDISSSIEQLKSWYEDKAIEINVDYTNFENFVHFSSATERIHNFVYKIGLLEDYQNQIQTLQSYGGGSSTELVVSSSVISLQNNISRIIEKFDTYEYYLYYSSESFSWPKNNSVKPYVQTSVTSALAIDWVGSDDTVPSAGITSMLFSASYYDAQNQNKLTNSIPSYIVDDDSNEPYLTFLNMVGHHFDNIWLYYKDVSNRYNASNNPYVGISKDVVADALRGFGVQLYTNSSISDSVYFSLFGVNPDGSLLPPTGSEMITTIVTSSLDTLASNEVQKEIYKRLYHNLPYLLKSRGTQRGVKALLACYGIPESILTVKEYGGYNRYDNPGILEASNDKITYGTSNASLNTDLLNPYVTNQYFSNDNYINTTEVEVAFSPSDNINAHITGTYPNLNLENIIGNPGYLLSGSYEGLDRLRDNYFRSYYVTRFNLWDYVRLLKFYNNSVFKMIKDFVPARSNVSTGIVIRDHILHRNKYGRHEPNADISQNYSESIDTAFIEGDAANPYSQSFTHKSGYHTSSLGYVAYTTTDNVERFTGEFQNSYIEVTNINSFNPQYEVSSITTPDAYNIGVVTQSMVALFQNVSQSLRSRRFFDLDYTHQQNSPVNFQLINGLMQRLDSANPQLNEIYDDPNTPYAYMQDYNYYVNAYTVPRYYGSKTQSSKYTFYVDGESGSYGNTAAIDKLKFQYAYLVDIYTASFNLPGRANSQIKYILDNNQNVLDLTKANTNIFFTQNIFKTGESANVSLFDYDPRNPDVQFLTGKKNLQIYEGGWRYSPILYRLESSSFGMDYFIDPPQRVTQTLTYTPPAEKYLEVTSSIDDFSIFAIDKVPVGFKVLVSVENPLVTGIPKIHVEVFAEDNFGNYAYGYTIFDGTVGPLPPFQEILFPTITGTIITPIISNVYVESSAGGTPITTTTTTYTSIITDNDIGSYNGVYAPLSNNSSSVWLSVTQSRLDIYASASAQYTPSIQYNIDSPVFKIYLENGDMLKLKDQLGDVLSPQAKETIFWPESEEYRIIGAIATVDINNNRRIQIELDRPINPATLDNSEFPSPISYYIFNKHVPDETNVILRYDPKSNITQDGVLFPEYIRESDKDASGNTIKSLRSQNLFP